MKLERIAVGIDFSRQCEEALAHARPLALRFGAELLLLHVNPAASRTLSGEMSRRLGDISRSELGRAHQELERLARVSREEGISARAEMVAGEPQVALAAAADELGANLVVVGTHGRTGLRRMLLGSVAERTVRQARSSVLVARRQPGDGRGYGRILVPTDFSQTAERALEAAISLARPGARIELLHCWELPVPLTTNDMSGAALVEPLRQETREEVLQGGERLVRRFSSGTNLDFAFHERMRPASQGIQEMLGERDYDLVAMGSHGNKGLRRWLLGSVAEVTVRHAPCATFVIKSPLRE